MVVKDPDNWLVYAYSADRYAADYNYQEAIKLNQKAFELQPSPKYADAPECIAHIYEIMGDYDKAIKASSVCGPGISALNIQVLDNNF